MGRIIDLSKLPPPDVVEPLNFEDLYQRRKARFIAQYQDAAERAHWEKVLSLESDPVAKLLQENAYHELIYRARINEAAQAVMLAYAAGRDLEHLAANYGIERKVIQAADPSARPPLEAILETDADLRARVQAAFERLSVAGPRGAYEQHALDAHPLVYDVSAVSPQPAEVVLTVLGANGNGSVSEEIINAVRAAVNDESIRPVGDRVSVQSAEIVEYQIEAVLYLYPGPEAELITAAARRGAEQYAKEKRRIGKDIAVSAVSAAMHVEGVQRIVVNQPPRDIVINNSQAAFCTGINISVGGYDN